MAIDFSFKQALIGAAVIYACYYIYWQLTVGARRRAMIKEHGCQPVKKFHVKDPIFGIDLMRLNLKALKERTLLETNYNRFKSEGVNTMTFPNLGRQIIVTTEPENLKSIQAKNFKAWGLGSRRKKSFQPFLGIGIFTTDGADWHHSREMLRPNFVRSQVGDLDTFETHISALIEAIPKDGSTVDLQELFFRLTMDSATEFLFGESTNTLAPEHRGGGQGGSGDFASRFAEAFNRGQETMASSTRWGPLFALIPQKQYEQDKKFVHGEFIHILRELITRPNYHTNSLPCHHPHTMMHRTVANLPRRLRRLLRPQRPLPPPRPPRLQTLRQHPLPLHRRASPANRRPHPDPERTPQHPPRRPRHDRLPPLQRLVHPLQTSRHLGAPPLRRRLPKRPTPDLRTTQRPEIPPRPAQRESEGPPDRPRQQPRSRRRHRPPPRRRPRRHRPHLHPQGPDRRLERLHHAPSDRLLRAGRRDFRPGPLARRQGPPPRLGVSALQWRAAHLSGPAVCADGGGVCDGETRAGVWGDRE